MPATRYRLQRIVAAREADVCDSQPPASVAGLEAYGEDTAAQMLYLQARWRRWLPCFAQAWSQLSTVGKQSLQHECRLKCFCAALGHHISSICGYAEADLLHVTES